MGCSFRPTTGRDERTEERRFESHASNTNGVAVARGKGQRKSRRREAGGLLAPSTNTFNLAIESDVRGVAVLLGRTGRFGRSRRRRHGSFRCAMMHSSKDRVGREERDHRDCQKRSRARFHVTRRFSALSLPLFGTTS
jgi:hypothetical protein